MRINKLYPLLMALAIFVSACSSSVEPDPQPTKPSQDTTQNPTNKPTNNPTNNPGDTPQDPGVNPSNPGVEPSDPGSTPPAGTTDVENGELGITLGGLNQDSWIESAPIRIQNANVQGSCLFERTSGSNYTGDVVYIDMTPVYEAFLLTEEQFADKISSGEIAFAAYEPGGTLNYNTTANGYGFWFNADGKVTQHGSNSVIAVETTDFTSYTVAQYPGAAEPGAKYVVSIAYVYTYESKQYLAIVEITANLMKNYTAADFTVQETLNYTMTLSKEAGYGGPSIKINEDDVLDALGTTKDAFTDALSKGHIQLVPMNADGTDGENTATGEYGAWFGADGTTNWGNNDLVFLEIYRHDIFTYNTGCHASHVNVGDVVTVRMQYRDFTTLNACNVHIDAKIES